MDSQPHHTLLLHRPSSQHPSSPPPRHALHDNLFSSLGIAVAQLQDVASPEFQQCIPVLGGSLCPVTRYPACWSTINNNRPLSHPLHSSLLPAVTLDNLVARAVPTILSSVHSIYPPASLLGPSALPSASAPSKFTSRAKFRLILRSAIRSQHIPRPHSIPRHLPSILTYSETKSEPDIPVESPGSSQSQSQSPTGRSSTSGRKRRRSTRQSTPHSPSSGGDSPKSDSSAREKMRRTKIEESTENTQISKSNHNADDEMGGVQIGEVSPGAKGRKRVHDEIASSSKDSKTPAEDPEDRPPSRQANGEPLGKKLRETPSPPREIDENCMFAPVPVEIEHAAYLAANGIHPIQKAKASPSSSGDTLHDDSHDASNESSLHEQEPTPPVTEKNSPQSCCNDSIDDDSSNNDRHNESKPLMSPPREESPVTEYEDVSREQKLTGEKLTANLEPSVEQKQPDSPASENAASPPKEESKSNSISQLGGGFSNTSSVSPFGSLAAKATETTTSESGSNGDSLFAASKFSSFSKVTSAFGVSPTPLGPSPFAAPPTGSDNVFSKMSSTTTQSVFAPPSGPNVFAVMSGNTSASGFGGMASSTLGSGTSIFGSAPSKPLPKAQPLEGIKAFGKADARDDQDSESLDGGEGASGDATEGESHETVKSASILPPKPAIKSGEEEYDMVFQARAKLFEFSSGAWKERGIGNIRVLTPKAEEYTETDERQVSKKPPAGRIVMRQEGVGRLILNANMFKDMLLSAGKQTSENTIRFMAVNSVSFAEAQDEKTKDDKVKDGEKEANDKENNNDEEAEVKKADEHQPAVSQKSVLKNYLLRFKSSDLVTGFRENVAENCPV
ncbi:hypothetical protein Dda_0384 [Drechslerella dactyloides]|uniref:RanBD1 domain-containing protein n=1 Tax=Drechslerella dactyloides TaxID=74499 RepID=A0AAD6J7T9_DREDA|nr:hypothetical protein Dda_0384 [Drechslerella dactyloides]